MFKITITQLNSKGKEQIIDVRLCETRDEAEQFIKDCKALPKEYRPTEKAPTCFYENHFYNGIRQKENQIIFCIFVL